MADKTEYPPILSPGLHRMTPDELREATVKDFPLSNRREALWGSLEFVLNTLKSLKIPCELWIDGSFLTKKIDPDDVDFVVDIPIETFNTATAAQGDFIDNLSDQLYRTSDNLHSFVMFSAPVGDAAHADAVRVHEQWKKDFGFAYISREEKGIAVIEVQP